MPGSLQQGVSCTCPPGIDKETGQIIDIGRDHNGALLVPHTTNGVLLYAWYVWQIGWDRPTQYCRL